MTVYGNDVYQSFCGSYQLTKTQIDNLSVLLADPRKHWMELTTHSMPPEFPIIVQYSQPDNFDLSQIKSKYNNILAQHDKYKKKLLHIVIFQH